MVGMAKASGVVTTFPFVMPQDPLGKNAKNRANLSAAIASWLLKSQRRQIQNQ